MLEQFRAFEKYFSAPKRVHRFFRTSSSFRILRVQTFHWPSSHDGFYTGSSSGYIPLWGNILKPIFNCQCWQDCWSLLCSNQDVSPLGILNVLSFLNHRAPRSFFTILTGNSVSGQSDSFRAKSVAAPRTEDRIRLSPYLPRICVGFRISTENGQSCKGNTHQWTCSHQEGGSQGAAPSCQPSAATTSLGCLKAGIKHSHVQRHVVGTPSAGGPQRSTIAAEAGPEPSLSQQTTALVVRWQQQEVGSLRCQEVQNRTNNLPQNQVTGEKLDRTVNQTDLECVPGNRTQTSAGLQSGGPFWGTAACSHRCSPQTQSGPSDRQIKLQAESKPASFKSIHWSFWEKSDSICSETSCP